MARTLDAMRAGVDVIYQATLRDGARSAMRTSCASVPRPPTVGAWSYEVADTKLARQPKAKFVVQLAFYSHLLERWRRGCAAVMHVVLGDGSERSFRCADYAHYFDALLRRFLARVQDNNAPVTYPDPCAHCSLCRWEHLCDQRRLA